jgi:hypothetical protein
VKPTTGQCGVKRAGEELVDSVVVLRACARVFMGVFNCRWVDTVLSACMC